MKYITLGVMGLGVAAFLFAPQAIQAAETDPLADVLKPEEAAALSQALSALQVALTEIQAKAAQKESWSAEERQVAQSKLIAIGGSLATIGTTIGDRALAKLGGEKAPTSPSAPVAVVEKPSTAESVAPSASEEKGDTKTGASVAVNTEESDEADAEANEEDAETAEVAASAKGTNSTFWWILALIVVVVGGAIFYPWKADSNS